MEEKRHIVDDSHMGISTRADYDLILSDINLFKKDKRFFFIYKKTGRLVSAIYLLTDLFSDLEPLKWALRDQSIKIISSVVSSKENLRKPNGVGEAELELLKLAGLIETVYFGGLISEMNATIISKEISALIKNIDDHIGPEGGSGFKISPELFEVDKGQYKGQQEIKDSSRTGVSEESDIHKRRSFFESDIKQGTGKHLLSSKNETSEGTASLKEISIKKINKNDRQVEIIGIIKDKRNVSIKDISDVITDCSEKTIQRELLAMVESGVLKKEGERRWSRYSLNL